MKKAVISEGLLTNIANAIRSKTEEGGLLTPAQMAEEISGLTVPKGGVTIAEDGVYDIAQYSEANVDRSAWVRPDDCPDLESVTLPGSDTENTVYVLYEKGLGVDNVQIRTSTGVRFSAVYKGTITGGEFVGELVANDVFSYSDTLTSKYTVYKVVGSDTLFFADAASGSYPISLQGVIWVYGEAPMTTTFGGTTTTTCAFSIHTRKYKLINTKNVASLALPGRIRAFSPVMDYYVGVSSNGDFNGNAVTRVGNGAMFYQNPYDKNPVIIKNATITGNPQYAFASMTNVEFDNVTCENMLYYFRDAPHLKRIVVRPTCTAKIQNASYLCSQAYQLEYCDLSPVDFSESTNMGSMFAECSNLKYLRLNNTIHANLDISHSILIDPDCVKQIMADLPSVTDSQKLTIPYGVYNYGLTAEDIAVATNKGWQVATA